VVLTRIERRTSYLEIFLVFGITLGLSGIRSLLQLLNSLLQTTPLGKQTVAIITPTAKVGLIDLAGQLAYLLELLCWGGLGLYLLYRGGQKLADIGLAKFKSTDFWHGLALTALIGIPGLLLYFLARATNLNLNVAPAVLNDAWWRLPVLILLAFGNAWAEETLVIGYLLTALRRLGWKENNSLVAAALLRGSYHLYQGFGGGLGNFLMGLIFGKYYQKANRLYPLIIAHTLLDVFSFLGYTILKKYLTWL
jgi:membrane protease YdiL (CAAX protease family)